MDITELQLREKYAGIIQSGFQRNYFSSNAVTSLLNEWFVQDRKGQFYTALCNTKDDIIETVSFPQRIQKYSNTILGPVISGMLLRLMGFDTFNSLSKLVGLVHNTTTGQGQYNIFKLLLNPTSTGPAGFGVGPLVLGIGTFGVFTIAYYAQAAFVQMNMHLWSIFVSSSQQILEFIKRKVWKNGEVEKPADLRDKHENLIHTFLSKLTLPKKVSWMLTKGFGSALFKVLDESVSYAASFNALVRKYTFVWELMRDGIWWIVLAGNLYSALNTIGVVVLAGPISLLLYRFFFPPKKTDPTKDPDALNDGYVKKIVRLKNGIGQWIDLNRFIPMYASFNTYYNIYKMNKDAYEEYKKNAPEDVREIFQYLELAGKAFLTTVFLQFTYAYGWQLLKPLADYLEIPIVGLIVEGIGYGEKFGKWLENSGVTDVGLKNTANIRAVMMNYVFGGVRENLAQTLPNIPFYESIANSTSLVPQPF